MSRSKALVKGNSNCSNSQRVHPEDIKTTAHFTIEGELDDISGAGQTEAAHSLCYNVPKARQKHLEVKGAGHYGIFSGRRWRDNVYPAVKSIIHEQNQAWAPAERAETAIKTIADAGPVAAVTAPEPAPAPAKTEAPAASAQPVRKTAARKPAVKTAATKKPVAKKAASAK